MMQNIVIICTVFVSIAGCVNYNDVTQQSYHYRCDESKEITVSYGNSGKDTASVTLRYKDNSDQWLRLKSAVSASGAKYSDGHHTWWSKGKTGFLKIGDVVVLRGCVASGLP